MRVIDKNELLEDLKSRHDYVMADVAPVVRCKDCKYYGAHTKGSNIKFCFQHLNSVFAMPEDGFCSYGAKMDLEVEYERVY